MGKSRRYTAAVIMLATTLTAACSGSDEPVESGKVKLLSPLTNRPLTCFTAGIYLKSRIPITPSIT